MSTSGINGITRIRTYTGSPLPSCWIAELGWSVTSSPMSSFQRARRLLLYCRVSVFCVHLQHPFVFTSGGCLCVNVQWTRVCLLCKPITRLLRSTRANAKAASRRVCPLSSGKSSERTLPSCLVWRLKFCLLREMHGRLHPTCSTRSQRVLAWHWLARDAIHTDPCCVARAGSWLQLSCRSPALQNRTSIF